MGLRMRHIPKAFRKCLKNNILKADAKPRRNLGEVSF